MMKSTDDTASDILRTHYLYALLFPLFCQTNRFFYEDGPGITTSDQTM